MSVSDGIEEIPSENGPLTLDINVADVVLTVIEEFSV